MVMCYLLACLLAVVCRHLCTNAHGCPFLLFPGLKKVAGLIAGLLPTLWAHAKERTDDPSCVSYGWR